MAFTLNTKKLVKIWFSTEPAIFMNLTNQLRMVRFRDWNKSAEITLVYSSKMLNAQAKQELLRFCKQYKIIPLDFDTKLKAEIELNGTSEEKELLHLAQQELRNITAKKFGDVAAASDIIRLLRPVLRRGIYSDLDCEFDFSKLPEKIKINGSVLLNMASAAAFFNLLKFADMSNDFIGLSEEHYFFEEEDLLKRAQRKIILNYKDLKFTCKGLGSLTKLFDKRIHDYMESKKPENIFKYREFLFKYITVEMLYDFFSNEVAEAMDNGEIEATPTLEPAIDKIQKDETISDEEFDRKIVNCFIRDFIEKHKNQFSGEKILSMYDNNEDLIEEFITILSMNMHKNLILELSGPTMLASAFEVSGGNNGYDIDKIENLYAIYKNPVLKEFSKNTQFVCTAEKVRNPSLIPTDFYWLDACKKKFDEKEREMVKAASLIQTAYRGYREKQRPGQVEAVSVKSDNSATMQDQLLPDDVEQNNQPWYRKFCCF